MRKTFAGDDDSVMINICIGKDLATMPREFGAVSRDAFKVFTYNGFPKPLGAAQSLAGVFITAVNVLNHHRISGTLVNILGIPFVVFGILTYVAGHVPNIRLTKASFCLNVVGFLWSAASLCLSVFRLRSIRELDSSSSELELRTGIRATSMSLLAAEGFIALFLIYWQSQAVCRQRFVDLPVIQITEQDNRLSKDH